jgi:hypothetical protein
VPGPCAADEDCALDGSADGRVCNEGACEYAACTVDLQCGSRICENGVCADRELCLNDESCGAGRVCVGNACREACVSDGECPSLGGVALAACVDGECVQRCLGDFMCLTGICQDNLCVAPECAADGDCEGPGSHFCEAGRCTQFTPCEDEEDCFDPSFLCNDLGRCQERAACTVDAECGAGLCLDHHCREAQPCTLAEGCQNDRLECIASRCVAVSECREDADCNAGEACDAARCTELPAPVDPAILVVRTSHGPCVSELGGACDVVCLAGNAVAVPLQGYDADGLPVATLALAAGQGATIEGSNVLIPCAADGELTVSAGPVSILLTVHAIPRSVDGLTVVVMDALGVLVSGASVFVEDAPAGITGSDGALVLDPFSGGTVGAAHEGVGVIVLDAVPGALFLTLPAAAGPAEAGGFRARVNGSGDELGAVGLGLALPSTASAFAATPTALLGDVFAGAVELPLLGAVPVALPASATLDATLLVVGAQEVKALAFDTAIAGPGALLAFEGRFDQQLLFAIAFGADPIEVGLDLVALAEGMDARLGGAGLIEDLSLVVDGDLADGIADVDGDGDVFELVPDYSAFPEIELQPDTSPLERVGLVVSPPPLGANARALAVCGLELAHGFLPLGVGVVFGSTDGEQVKVKSAPATASAPSACVVHALFAADDTVSAALVRSDAFAASLDVGALLAPPAGAFLLEGVPSADRTSVIAPESPGADTLVVTLLDGDVTWQVIAAARGSITLPSYLEPIALGATKALVLGVAVVDVLASPHGSLEDTAAAVAVSP